MFTDDLLRGSTALRRRIQQSPDLSPTYFRQDIAALADNASIQLRPDEVVLRSKLCVVRSLAFLGRPFAAIAAFDAALANCPPARWQYIPASVGTLNDVDTGRPMDVEATIVSFTRSGGASSSEMHRFEFALSDAEHAPVTNTITLRTALVLTRELSPTTAFGKMIDAIATADDKTYDELVGRIFKHA